jgi:hypothetical protein
MPQPRLTLEARLRAGELSQLSSIKAHRTTADQR